MTISLPYSHLPALTPTPARRPASKLDMRRPAFELRWNNGYNSGYDMEGMGDKCAGDRKEEELGHGYY